jgi:uncharacterized damage-inducible protein DinB
MPGKYLLDTSILIQAVLLRELGALAREVEAYPDEDALWRRVPGITNSGGTLARHLAGNIQHFVGAVLGDTGYVRDREAEFSQRVDRATLLAEIEAARRAVETVLTELAAERLEADFPAPVAKRTVRTGDFLLHLVSHFAYHLGQVDYHRRMVTGDATTVNAVAAAELPGRPAGG